MNSLDFTMLPTLEKGSAVYRLPPELDRKLSAFPATYDRARGALSFSVKINHEPRCDDGADMKARESLIRAALGEYVSMEEAIKWDRPDSQTPRIRDSRNPLLHMMKELRNLQFHEITSPLRARPEKIIYAGTEFDVDLYCVEDLKEEDFDRLNNAKFYSPDDKTRMIQWFNENQAKWGVSELILRAVTIFARDIVRTVLSEGNPIPK